MAERTCGECKFYRVTDFYTGECDEFSKRGMRMPTIKVLVIDKACNRFQPREEEADAESE